MYQEYSKRDTNERKQKEARQNEIIDRTKQYLTQARDLIKSLRPEDQRELEMFVRNSLINK